MQTSSYKKLHWAWECISRFRLCSPCLAYKRRGWHIRESGRSTQGTISMITLRITTITSKILDWYPSSKGLFWRLLVSRTTIQSFIIKDIVKRYYSEWDDEMLQGSQSWRSSKTTTRICQSLPATADPVCREDEANPIWKQLQQQQTVGGDQQQQLPRWRVKIGGEGGRGTNRGRNHTKLCLPMHLLSLLSVQSWWGGLPPVYWLKIQSHICSCPTT